MPARPQQAAAKHRLPVSRPRRTREIRGFLDGRQARRCGDRTPARRSQLRDRPRAAAGSVATARLAAGTPGLSGRKGSCPWRHAGEYGEVVRSPAG